LHTLSVRLRRGALPPAALHAAAARVFPCFAFLGPVHAPELGPPEASFHHPGGRTPHTPSPAWIWRQRVTAMDLAPAGNTPAGNPAGRLPPLPTPLQRASQWSFFVGGPTPFVGSSLELVIVERVMDGWVTAARVTAARFTRNKACRRLPRLGTGSGLALPGPGLRKAPATGVGSCCTHTRGGPCVDPGVGAGGRLHGAWPVRKQHACARSEGSGAGSGSGSGSGAGAGSCAQDARRGESGPCVQGPIFCRPWHVHVGVCLVGNTVPWCRGPGCCGAKSAAATALHSQHRGGRNWGRGLHPALLLARERSGAECNAVCGPGGAGVRSRRGRLGACRKGVHMRRLQPGQAMA
jgi:hypothetical protein